MKNSTKNNLYGIEVPLQIFSHDISVLCGDKQKAYDYIKSKDKEFVDETVLKNYVDGFSFKHWIYIGKKSNNYEVITHELVHAVNKCFDLRNIVWSDANGQDEIFAYTLGFAVAYVLNTKNKQWYILKNNKWIKQK